MKLTKKRLKEIIKEELAAKVNEISVNDQSAWVEADKECAKEGPRNSKEYKKCMKGFDINVDEAISPGEEMKARIRRDQLARGHVASPTGTPSGDDWTLRTQAIHNLLGKKLRSDLERAEALRDLADELEESHHDRGAGLGLEEGHYNKDPRPCADDERYQPPNRNDYRQFGKCVKKEKKQHN